MRQTCCTFVFCQCNLPKRAAPSPEQTCGGMCSLGRVSIPQVIHKTMKCWLELNVGPLLGSDFDEFCSLSFLTGASDTSACIWSMWLHFYPAVGVERLQHQCRICSDSWLLNMKWSELLLRYRSCVDVSWSWLALALRVALSVSCCWLMLQCTCVCVCPRSSTRFTNVFLSHTYPGICNGILGY